MRIQRRSQIAFLTLFGTVYLLLSSTSVGAQKLPPKALFGTGPAELKTLVEEIKYQYYVRKYSPPVKVKFVKKKEECSYSSPEEIVIAHLSAMAAVDYEWDVSCWNEESQKINAAQYRSANITPDHLKEKWKEVFKGSQFELVTRVDFRGGVAIQYKVIRQSNAKPKTFTFQNVAKKQADGKWKLTQELAANTVKNKWHIPEEKVKRTISYEPP